MSTEVNFPSPPAKFSARPAIPPLVALGVFLISLMSIYLPAPNWPAIFGLTLLIYVLIPWGFFWSAGVPSPRLFARGTLSVYQTAMFILVAILIVPVYLGLVLSLSQVYPQIARAIRVDIRSIQTGLREAPLWAIAVSGLFLAWAEEFFFRVFLQNSLQKWGGFLGLIIASVCFALAHISFGKFLPMMLMGLWFGYVYWRSGSIWLCTLAHFFINGSALLGVFYLQSVTSGRRLVLPIVDPVVLIAGIVGVVGMIVWLELMLRQARRRKS